MSEEKCPICDNQNSRIQQFRDGSNKYHVECNYCGKFVITGTLKVMAERAFEQFGERYLYSSILRNRFEEGTITELDSNSIKKLPNSIFIPQNPIERIDYLLKIMSNKTSRPGDRFKIDGKTAYPLLFAKDRSEFEYYLDNAIALGYIESPRNFDDGYMISLSGWQRLEMNNEDSNHNKVFVAMCFDEDLNEAWEKGFKSGLLECDLQPIRVNLEEHNEKICDKKFRKLETLGC